MNLVGFDNYEDLVKGIDKTKMVQVRVTVHGKNGDFQRMQWKNPKDVTSSDVLVSKPDDVSMKTAKKPDQPSGSKQRLAQILGGHSRDKVLDFAKQNGVKWVETNHAGINWMRASIAIQKHMDENSDAWKAFESGKDSQQPTVTDQKNNPADQGDAKKDKVDKTSSDDKNKQKTAEKKSKPDKQTVDKDKTKQLVDKLGKDNVLETMKTKGITWTETDHKGINWMRAMQALGKHLNDNPSGFDDMVSAADNLKTKQDLQNTQKQVQQLQDLVSQMQKPTAQQVVKTQTQVDILQGLTTDTMSDYEKSHFGDIISSASPESLRNYRTLGMCAGDKESEEYLANLYHKYIAVVTDANSVMSGFDEDPLQNKLKGVVSKPMVKLVKSTLNNSRSKISRKDFQNKFLEPWTNPNRELTQEQTETLKTMKELVKLWNSGKYDIDQMEWFSQNQVDTLRQEYQTEIDSNYEYLHTLLNKYKLSKEYGSLAEEYDGLLTDYENSIFRNRELNNFLSDNKRLASMSESDLKSELKKHVEGIMEYRNKHGYYNFSKYDSYGDDDSDDDKKKIGYEFNLQLRKHDSYSKLKKEKDDFQFILDNLDKINVKKALENQSKLFNPKFTDLVVNLYHNRMISSHLAENYEISKNFVDEYPILSKDNLDKLCSGDEDSLIALSLYVSAFRPSMSKGGKDANAAMIAKYQERKEILETYGGVKPTNNAKGYSENNEIKCKVSKADDKKSKEIIDKIASDWDTHSHGRMKYKIHTVFEISGLASEQDFEKVKKQNKQYQGITSGGKKCDSDFFYHGTGSMATSLILGHSGEFKVGKAKVGRMLGDGIYLADKSSKSAQYIDDKGYSRSGASGSLMVVEASLGNTLQECSSDKHTYKYDSVHAGKSEGLLNNEWCVHNTKSIVPRYLVQMELL